MDSPLLRTSVAPGDAKLHWFTLRFLEGGGGKEAAAAEPTARLEASFQLFCRACLRSDDAAATSGPLRALLHGGVLYATLLVLAALEHSNTAAGIALVAARLALWALTQAASAMHQRGPWRRWRCLPSRCRGTGGVVAAAAAAVAAAAAAVAAAAAAAAAAAGDGGAGVSLPLDLAFFLGLFSSGFVVLPGMDAHVNLPVRAMAGLALFGGGGGSGRLGVAAAGYSGGGFGRAAAVAALFCAGDLGFACTQLGCGLCGGGGSSGAGAGQHTALLSGVFLSYATVLLSCVLALLSRAHGAERALRQAFYRAKVTTSTHD